MASGRAQKSGFALEAKNKLDAKYDVELAEQAMSWINRTITKAGFQAINTSGAQDNVYQTLGDGFVLCRLMKALGENVKVKDTPEKLAFKKMECINNFLIAAEKYGVPKIELFQTVDLYEQQNLGQVIMTIQAVGRKVNSKGGDGIGPKEAQRQSREWTDEQLKAGQNIIGLQMGTNKGASQAGQNFGKARMITD